jgi:hypothetical protein
MEQEEDYLKAVSILQELDKLCLDDTSIEKVLVFPFHLLGF